MKFNKDSNSYTFIFSTIIVVIVGVILSSITLSLADKKSYNVKVKKMMSILSAMGVESDRSNGEELYEKYITDSYVISRDGVLLDNKDLPVEKHAFNFDVLKQNRDKTIAEKDRIYPVFEGEKDGEKLLILPMVGSGLWGPVWGYVALADDYTTIVGASFDHQGETPGLGAEISQSFFEGKWEGKVIAHNGKFDEIKIVKDGSGTKGDVNQHLDGITGGTVTSLGVEKMVNSTLAIYYNYFSKNN